MKLVDTFTVWSNLAPMPRELSVQYNLLLQRATVSSARLLRS
jgi:hypothetical protein